MRRSALLKRLLFAALLFVAIVAPGCGYRFAGQGTRLPPSIKSVSIPVFENDTAQPNLEITVTQAVTEKFIKDGRLAVVAGGGDSVISGAIKSYALEPVAYDSLNRVSQYRVKMTVQIMFEDKTGKGISFDRVLPTQWEYKLDPAITAAEAAREEANREAARYLGDRIVGLILEGF